MEMDLMKAISSALAIALLSGCAATHPSGSKGPKLVGSGKTTESGQYAEVGVEFTSTGDFFALFSPKRWGSPIATGGSLSWLNPNAWSEDAGRTGRILIGEAVVVGGIAAAAGGGGGGGSDSGGSSSSGPTPPGGGTGGGTPNPPPPPAP